jgi:hypothetical protein
LFALLAGNRSATKLSSSQGWESRAAGAEVPTRPPADNEFDDCYGLPRRTTAMRQLLRGVAVAITLGAASATWAQNPSGGNPAPTPTSPPTAQPAPAASGSAASAAQHAKAMHVFHKRMSRRAAAAGNTTAQLNRRELARIQAGDAGHPAPGSAMPGK